MKEALFAVFLLLNMFCILDGAETLGIKQGSEHSEEDTCRVSKLPGEYPDFSQIYPLGLIELDPEGNEKPEKFRYSYEFILWVSEMILGESAVSAGIRYGATYGRIFSRNPYVESFEENELYKYYDESFLKDLFGKSGSWFFDFSISENKWLQPEIKYHHYSSSLLMKNVVIESEDRSMDITRLLLDVEMHYITFPLLLRYRLAQRSNSTLYFLAGPGINIFISGNADWEYHKYIENGSELVTERKSTELEDQKNVSTSMILSLGFSYESFFMEVRYEGCLTDMRKLESSYEIGKEYSEIEQFLHSAYDYRNYHISINLGYKLGRKWGEKV